MRPIVTKFGGSSLADTGQFKKVRDIVKLDSRRLFVVPSAPGRRFDGDDKVTDLLYKCHSLNAAGEDFKWVFDIIRERYLEIARELSLTVDIGKYLGEVEKNIAAGASSDYCASRGEYLNGLLMADFLGYTFVDPQNGIFFGATAVSTRKRPMRFWENCFQRWRAPSCPAFTAVALTER